MRLAAVALSAALVVLAGCGDGADEVGQPAATETPAEASSTESMPAVPASRPFSWDTAGAFVWHETDVSPEVLGADLLNAGFGWVAVLVNDGMAGDPVEDDWVNRLRRATGLPVGGWGVLREQPVAEAQLAHELVERYGLDFFIANAEAEYSYSGPDGPSAERFARSSAFVGAFRERSPQLPAALSSYCRPDRHDLDWSAWSVGGFTFLPQAYVNDFGQAAAPAVCARASARYFWSVHPTIGMHPGARRSLGAWRYAQLLERAGTLGFSVYLAETRMTRAQWSAFGDAIATRGVARAADTRPAS